MKRLPVLAALLVAAAVAFTLGTAAAPQGGDRKPGLFAPPGAGQRVGLKERAGGYEISVVPGVPLAQPAWLRAAARTGAADAVR